MKKVTSGPHPSLRSPLPYDGRGRGVVSNFDNNKMNTYNRIRKLEICLQ